MTRAAAVHPVHSVHSVLPDLLGSARVLNLALLLLLPLSAHAADVDLFRISQATVGAAAVADVVSSYGLIERNPVLGRGPFGPPEAAISLGATACALLLQEIAVRKFPKSRKWLIPVNFIVGGLRFGVAARNWRLQ